MIFITKISVIIPVFNCDSTIEKTLDSLRNQNVDINSFEVIVIDDGSTDNTYFNLIDYKNQYPFMNIVIKKQENEGPSSARNQGIKIAKGEYIMFLDADDYFDINMINVMYKLINENKTSQLIICGIKKINKSSEYTYFLPSKTIKGRKNIALSLETLQKNQLFNPIWNKIFKREIIIKNNIRFDPDLKMGEDFKFNLEYLTFINSLVICDKVLYNYDIGNSYLTNSTRKNDFETRKNNIILLENYYNNNDIDKDLSIQYIKIFYSEIFNEIDMRNKDMPIIIEELLSKPEIKLIKKNYKPNSIVEILLFLPIRYNSKLLVLGLSNILNTFRKKTKINKKRISM